MRSTARLVLAGAAATLFMATQASAQELTVRVRQPASVVVPGATVTIVALASNKTAHDTVIIPKVTVPAGWQVLNGESALPVKGDATEACLISVVVPSGAAAGAYPIFMDLGFAGQTGAPAVRDSALVIVGEHRSVTLALLDKPAYALAGSSYDATFRIVNRGNSAANIQLSARSSVGKVSVPAVVGLGAGAAQDVVVRVALRDVSDSPPDEILEVVAVHSADSSAHAEAGARIVLIPRAGALDGFNTVSSVIRIRGASANGGIAPYEVIGGGKLSASGATELTFAAVGRTRGIARFGERETYRLELRAPSYRVRLGDNLYTLSSLTGGGQPGVGAAVEGSVGVFGVGAYGQRFRSSVVPTREVGTFVSARTPGSERGRITLNLVERFGGPFDGRIASSEISFRPDSRTLVDAEYAMSAGSGSAYNTRFAGKFGRATFDAGHHRADTAFAGPQRGSKHDYVDVHAPVNDRLRVSAFASRSSAVRSGPDSGSSNAFANAGVSTTLDNRLTLELSSLARSTGPFTERTREVRVRSELPVGRISLTADGKVGIGRDVATQATYLTRQVTLAPRVRFGRHTLAAHLGLADGSGVAGNRTKITTAGLDISTQPVSGTEIQLSGFGVRAGNAPWSAQADLRISQVLASQIVVSARAHLATRPVGSSALADANAFYLELAVPLQVPVLPKRGVGRVVGTVRDAATGRALPNTLVRVGSRVGVTNGSGRVVLTGVAPGEHRVSLGEDTTLASSVLSGSSTVHIDSTKQRTARFSVAVARGAGVNGEIRRMARAQTVLDSGAADSLVDAGPLENMLVALSSRRDTLYQTTDSKGRVSFTDVPPGEWVVTIVGADLPANHVFDRQSHDLSLAPGEVVTTSFRLLPRRRAVQMVASEGTGTVASGTAVTLAAKQR